MQDDIFPKQIESEKAVLCSLLVKPSLVDDVLAVVAAEDFFSEENQTIFQAIQTLVEENRKFDVLILAAELKRLGTLERIGGYPYLAEIAATECNAVHATVYAQEVRKASVLRSIQLVASSTFKEAQNYSNVEDVLAKAEQRLNEIRDGAVVESVTPLSDVVDETFGMIESRKSKGVEGIQTGFRSLDSLLGGFHPSELIILAARPGVGKTALALNFAEAVARSQQDAVLYVSLEMAKTELVSRLLCSKSGVTNRRIKNGTFNECDWMYLQSASEQLKRELFYIDDTPARSIAEISATARRLKRQIPLQLVVIDYLQLVEPDNVKLPRQEQVATMTRKLKQLARHLELPVLCLAQLNRQVEATKDARPKLSQLRESGAIEQDADVVLFIHREDYGLSNAEVEKNDCRGKSTLFVAKQRSGPTGDLPLFWNGETGTFSEPKPTFGNKTDDFDEYSF